MSPSIKARWSEAESSFDFVALRAVPTTSYPRARNAWTTPAPIPCDAPVTITVFRLLAIRLAQRFEPRAKLGHEDLRLFPGREVAAFVELAVMNELGIGFFCRTPRSWIQLVRKRAHGNGDGNAFDTEKRQLVFRIETTRRNPRVRQPVEGNVVEDVVSRQAFGLSVEDACDKCVTFVVVVDHPGGQADR